ncbi:MAG: efflux RND transporter permease subunit [Opitutaceae bacterium]|nr:efflux RND transporter permease subunit [Opitutaceae bacterium]
MSAAPRNFRPDDSLYAFTVKRPVAILMVVIAVCVFGAVSYQRLALTLMPDMSYPTLTVRTVYPGTAPEEVENIVSRPLEQQLGIIPKLVSISSISKAGQSDVILEFQWKTDMNLVAQEVREKIDRIRLPEGAQRPLLLHYDPSLDPIIRLGFAGPQSLYELRYMAEHELKRKLEALPGVAAIQVKGGLEEQFLIALDESKLATLKLDITQIGQRLAAGNVNLSGGNLREGQTEYVIRTLNEFRTLDEIAALIISRTGTVDIRLRDIASITRFHKDRDVITRVNGEESVEIEVFKEADANIVVVAETVRNAVFGTPEQRAYVATLDRKGADSAKSKSRAKLKPSAGSGRSSGSSNPLKALTSKRGGSSPLMSSSDPNQLVNHRKMTDFLAFQVPPGAKIELLADQSVFISKSIDEVKSNAISGALIAIIVLYLFLRNVGQTLIIALGIPISIVATFAPMLMWDVSLNIISLGGLALGVGMLVDNGIVVLESIFRCREEGDDLLTGVVRGTQEVGMAVIASTLTTVAVFFPIVFVEGVAGQMFGDMALTVVFSLLASLATALFLLPMLASRRFGPALEGVAKSRVVTSDFLQFPRREDSRWRDFTGVVRRMSVRFGWAVLVIIAAAVKAVVVLTAVILWPLRLLVQFVVRGVARSAAARLGLRAEGWWLDFATWAGADSLWRIRGDRVWPGMLSFGGVAYLGTGMTTVGRWISGRRWRWIVVLVVPAIVSLIVWAARDTAFVQSRLQDDFARWLRLQPRWWPFLTLGVAAVAFGFGLVRFACAVTLRCGGTIVIAALLGVAVIALGLARASSLVLWPFTGPGLNWFENGYQRLQRAYPPVIAAALRHRFAVLGGALAAFLLCWFLVLPRIGKDLIPQVHQGEFNLDVTLPIGTPLERTAEVAAEIDEVVLDQPEVERTALTVGSQEGDMTSAQSGEHTARLSVKLQPGLVAVAEAALIDRIRAEFQNLPEAKIEVSYPALFSFRNPIELEIRGHDLAMLKRVSREAEQLLSDSVPGLVDVKSTLQTGHPEIQIIYHRDRLAEYGLSLRNVADLVRNKVQGRIATQFRKDDQMIDIVVRLREEDRLGIEELRGLIVNPGSPVAIPLAAIAQLTVNEGPSEIRRVDQQRTALITANIRDADLATVSAEIVAVMSDMTLPSGFSFNIAGQNKEMKTSLNSLLLAFGLALFLVYIVMASQFESLVHPLLIMMTVPLALIGVALALWLGGIPLSIMVFLGLIILAGIVVNNAIVLIDYINTLRDRGLELTEAIVEAGGARLRPILMTTLTTVLGLFPMALGLGEGAEIRAPMAITVIVGLSTATLLTLVVIPTLYYLFPGKRGPTQIQVDDTVAEPESAPTAQPEPEPMAK